MVAKKIAYTRIDGGCTIISPNYNRPRLIRDEDGNIHAETEDEIFQRFLDTGIPSDAINPTIVTDADLPYSGWTEARGTRSAAMRNSWVNPPDNTSPPVIDMNKARKGKMEEYRKDRLPILGALDHSQRMAEEEGDNVKIATIIKEKKKLRDIPVDHQAIIDGINDPEELDRYNPVAEIVSQMPEGLL